VHPRETDQSYQNIPFPFSDTTTGSFTIEVDWDQSQLIGYLSTWSASKAYRHQHGTDPLSLIEQNVHQSFRDQAVRRFTFPVFLVCGYEV